MALPPRAIDELSREPVHTQGWYGQLLMWSGTLLFVALLVYGGISYGYKPYLAGAVKSLDTQIATFTEQIPEKDQAQFVLFYSQLVNVQTLLGQHVAVSNFFDWIEKNTVPNVYYTKLDVNVGNRQATLSGVARSVTDIAGELAVLENQPQVDHINFGNTTLGSGGFWQFNMTVFFVPGFFAQTSPLQ